jgi:hypothetical protein
MQVNLTHGSRNNLDTVTVLVTVQGIYQEALVLFAVV